MPRIRMQNYENNFLNAKGIEPKLVSEYQSRLYGLQCVTIEFRQGLVYVVNFQFSRCPDRC